jgi:TonB-linked SusC/RagA family outer membrane protein
LSNKKKGDEMLETISPPEIKQSLFHLKLNKFMKKHREWNCLDRPLKKLIRIMKLTSFLILVFVISVSAASSYSQSTKLNIQITNGTFVDVLKQIENQSEFYFYFNNDEIQNIGGVSISISAKKVEEVLDQLIKGTNLEYQIIDRYIAIKEKDSSVHDQTEMQQQKSVSGKVTDSTGAGLPGASVVVKGTATGIVTDNNGSYSLSNVPENATLQFSFIGMKSQEIAIVGKTTINVSLAEDAFGIEEVVAVGYGVLQRNRISTSITTLEPQKIKDQLTSSIEHSLEGKVAGLQIDQQSGAPGGSAQLRLRGSGSIGAGGDPLIVVDGIPIQNIYGMTQSPLTLVNQADIESISVLKDVSATSIYGSRGSNGVILITTKSAKKGKTEMSFNVRSGFSQELAIEKLDLMNAEEYALWRKENAYEKAEFYGTTIDINDIPEPYRNPEGLGTIVDWHDVVTRIAPQQEYNLSVTHGSEDFKGFFSIGYTDEEGIVKATDFKRLSIRANMNYTPNDFITIGLNLNPTIRWWGNRFDATRGSFYGLTDILSPMDGPGLDNNSWEQEQYFDGNEDYNIFSPGMFNNPNPLYALKKQTNKAVNYNMYFQPSLQLNLLKGLKFISRLNLTMAQESNEIFNPSTVTKFATVPPVQPYGNYDTNNNFNWQSENTLTYENNFGDHSIDLLGGYTREHYNRYWSNMKGENYPSDDIKTLNAATLISGGTWESNWSMISYLFRLNYNYKTKYLFTGAIRRDGSSRFGSEKRWGYFPSASVGWNITKEKFFPTPKWLSNLKLRASYGTSGNNNIGDYTWIPTLSATNYTFGGKLVDGKSRNSLENTNLSWEKSEEFNTGLDMSLFDGKLNFIVDYYKKVTNNMLWSVNVPTSSGFNSLMENIGKIQNKGLEFTINSINISNNNFTWQTDFNISFNRNKVLDLGSVDRILTSVAYQAYSIITPGQPMAMFYGLRSLGILKNQEEVDKYATFPGQLPGTPHYEDVVKDGVIDDKDRTIIGNPHPDFTGGISNNVTYKNWDFNISVSFVYNFDVMATLEEENLNLDGVFNVLKEVKDRWKSPEEPGNGRIAATFHQTAYDRMGNSDWVYNASFLKIQNITIGFTVDKQKFAKQLRLFCSVQNPFLITNYKYGNPVTNRYGDSPLVMNIDSHSYPLTRTIVLGLNMNF